VLGTGSVPASGNRERRYSLTQLGWTELFSIPEQAMSLQHYKWHRGGPGRPHSMVVMSTREAQKCTDH